MSSEHVDKKLHWSNAHSESSDYWLTKSDPVSVYEFHKLGPFIESSQCQKMLEVGIGSGDSIRHLAKHNSVVAVDIVQEALDKVKDVATTILVADLEEHEFLNIDFALCHLVLQHCLEDAARELLTGVIRHLNTGGFFSLQFATPAPDETPQTEQNKEMIRTGLMNLRSPEEMEVLVRECGGQIIHREGPHYFPGEGNVGWFFHRIVRAFDVT